MSERAVAVAGCVVGWWLQDELETESVSHGAYVDFEKDKKYLFIVSVKN